MKLLFEDKGVHIENNRQPTFTVDPIFINRWSPRAFDPEPIPENVLMTLFEAARWSMSCYNEQPWLFMYANEKDDLELYRSILGEWNQRWTVNAPVLGFIFCHNNFAKNDKPNHWAQLDAGAAWMALTIQARMLGLYTHGMAGFDRKGIYEKLGVPQDEFTALAAFALGKYGDREKLDEDFRKSEQPNERKPLNETINKGRYSK